MQYMFAPMEGITGYVFRNAHHKFCGGADAYYTPFITPTQNRKMTARELEDVRPEHNQGLTVVPQVLTNQADGFLWAADKLGQMGYSEVNLNLGCPSPTVVTKHRGAGFLERTDALNKFLETVSLGMEELGLDFSVKTRIGLTDYDEFPDLLQIYNRYPLKRLIIHPRVRMDFYGNHPHMESFALAVKESKNPVGYNGDLFSVSDYHEFRKQFPDTDFVMMGRGMLTNPFLALEMAQKTPCDRRKQMLAFHDELLLGYRAVIPGDKNVLFKMKELWSYLAFGFANGDRLVKKIKKAQRMEDYQGAVQTLFETCPLAEPPVFGGFGK